MSSNALYAIAAFHFKMGLGQMRAFRDTRDKRMQLFLHIFKRVFQFGITFSMEKSSELIKFAIVFAVINAFTVGVQLRQKQLSNNSNMRSMFFLNKY